MVHKRYYSVVLFIARETLLKSLTKTLIYYTHANKLGNTFSSWDPFSYFLAILNFLSHVFDTLA